MRAFSILEVIIAIALISVIVALVLPTAVGMSESVTFKETCEQVSAVVGACRGEAQRQGTPLEIVTQTRSDGRVALMSRPVVGAPTPDEPVQPDKGRSASYKAKVIYVLPRGYRVAALVQAHGPEAGSDERDSEESKREVRDEEPALVTFKPSGEATGSVVFLHGPNGRGAVGQVNSWTGSLSLREVEVETTTEPAAPSEPEGQPQPGPVTPRGPDLPQQP